MDCSELSYVDIVADISATTELHTKLHRALYSFASAGIGATSTFSFDLSDPDTLENTLQLCFFLAGGVVLMPTLNSYYGHGIRFDIDFLEKGVSWLSGWFLS